MPKKAPAFWSSDVIPVQKVSFPLMKLLRRLGVEAPAGGLGLEMVPENRADQVEAEEADPPEADDPGERQEHADDGVAPPSRVAEELGDATRACACSWRRPSRPRPRRPSSARAP